MKRLLVAAAICLLTFSGRGSGQDSGDGRPLVLLDNFYNNEWKTDGRRFPYHYLWCDTLDSGFSMLGGIIETLGARIDTLCRAPGSVKLRKAKIFIIVDPDTPTETEHPRTIDSPEADILAAWVRGGGILLLFGNDRGNAEFEHLNGLAGRFGIHFNEDSRNHVSGKDYEAGAFTNLPSHPLFAGVRKIYLKEISTLSLLLPAQPLLRESGDVIIAEARFGKGLVLAVGDPWLYNEYMDHRRLPAGFDNARAAKNLFSWLLSRAWTSTQQEGQ